MNWRRALLVLTLLGAVAHAQEDPLEASGRAVLEGRYADAAAQLREFLAGGPSGSRADRARHRLAFLLDKKLDDPRAAAELYRAVAARGGALASHARLHLADCLARADDVDGARTALAELVAEDPGHPRADTARRILSGRVEPGLPAGLARIAQAGEGRVRAPGSATDRPRHDDPPPIGPAQPVQPTPPPRAPGDPAAPPEKVPAPPPASGGVDGPSPDAPPVGPPVDVPPVDERPVAPPPADSAPADTSRVGVPPVNSPSVNTPPADLPPVDAPVGTPTVDAPPAPSPAATGRSGETPSRDTPAPSTTSPSAPDSGTDATGARRDPPRLPGDPAYVKQMAEEIVMAARAKTDEDRVTVLTEFARRRVAEAGLAAERGRHATAAELARAYQEVVFELRSVVAGMDGPRGERAAAHVSAALQLLAAALESAASAMRAAGAPDVLTGQVEAATSSTRGLDPAALRVAPSGAGGTRGGAGAGAVRSAPALPGRRR